MPALPTSGHSALSVSAEGQAHARNGAQVHLLHTSALIPFAQIKSPFQVLSAGLLVSTLSPGPAAGLTDLPSFPCCHRASLESFPGPLTPCGLEPLLSDTAEPVTE